MFAFVLLLSLFSLGEAAKWHIHTEDGLTDSDHIWILQDAESPAFFSEDTVLSESWIDWLNSDDPSDLFDALDIAEHVRDFDEEDSTSFIPMQTLENNSRLTVVFKDSANTIFVLNHVHLPKENMVYGIEDYDIYDINADDTLTPYSHEQKVTALDDWRFEVSGKEICGDTEFLVYYELFFQSPFLIEQPTVWVQSAGENLYFRDGAENRFNFNSGAQGIEFFEDTLENEDVCYSVQFNTGGTSFISGVLPISRGDRIFVAGGDNPNGHLDFIANVVGFNPFNDETILYDHVQIDGTISGFDESGDHLVIDAADTGSFVRLYDHEPVGDEDFSQPPEPWYQPYDKNECGTFDGDGNPVQWSAHPYDCVDGPIDSTACMYCKGRANDEVFEYCLPRFGAPCDTAFESVPGQTFCNLEFECEASYGFVSLMSALVALVLLLIQ